MKTATEGITLSPNNPFLSDFNNMLTGKRSISKEMTVPGGSLKETITYSREYVPSGKWTKLYQNRDVLEDLSPNACKLFLKIALTLEYNAERVHMTQKLSGMTTRTYPQAVKELTERRIIVQEKQSWYWVNVTILVMGKINLDSTKLVPSGL